MEKAAWCYTCETRGTCAKSGKGEMDDGSRSEVRGFLNFELGTSNFVSQGLLVSLTIYGGFYGYDGTCGLGRNSYLDRT